MSFLRYLLVTLCVSFFVSVEGVSCDYTNLAPPEWAHDQGPNPETPEGRTLIDLMADYPYMPGVSEVIMGYQKFRPAFAQVFYRLTNEDPLKILIQGQDATHIAEAAGRTATAGFGGRAQHMAGYFGVDWGAGFWNTYQNTIRGQYGSFDHPYIYFNQGKAEVRFGSYVDPHLWALTHEGPQARWRNDFQEELIKQHPELRLMILFGSAARDSAASFVESRGGSVEPRTSEKSMKDTQVPLTELKYAGGNNQFPVLIGKQGQDLYAEFLDRKMDYSKSGDREDAIASIENNLEWFMKRMVFTKAGPYKNGLLHRAQLGGYDLGKMMINGEPTINLRGLSLSDGSPIEQDLLVTQYPHPSSLSRMTREDASEVVRKRLEVFAPYIEKGWEITPDPGHTNNFAQGEPYQYGREDIGPEYYPYGTPLTRQVPVSTASRMRGAPDVIIWGTRDRVEFDPEEIEAARNSVASETLDPNQVWAAPTTGVEHRYQFDRGPGEYAKVMTEALDVETIFEPKPGKSYKKDGIHAFNVKNHPEVGPFGHYRGNFNQPRVLILADPHQQNGLITSVGMTGARGQYLQGLMNDIGVSDNYLAIKTVPFRMEGASQEEWSTVLEQTQGYRDAIFEKFLAENQPEMIIADGPKAKAELERILGKDDPRIINIQRGKTSGYGIRGAGKRIVEKFDSFQGKVKGEMADIPRSHLPNLARHWEGRGGDQVVSAKPGDPNEGLAFAVVAPKQATEQKVTLSPRTQKEVDTVQNKLQAGGFMLGGESVEQYRARTQKEESDLSLEN